MMSTHDVTRPATTTGQGGLLTRHRFRIAAGCCVSCAADLSAVRRLAGVTEVQVFDAAGLVVVTGRPGLRAEQVAAAAASSGITLEPARAAGAAAARRAWWRRGELLALAAAAVFLLAGLVLTHAGVSERAGQVLYWATIVVGGAYPLRGAIQILARRRVTIGVLLVVAAAGALALGRVEEAAELVVVFSLGEVLEGYATDRARGSIRALMALAPPEATRLTPEAEVTELVPVEELMPGDVVLVRPGERLPTDGRVIEGSSSIDQSPVTGESMPADVQPGAEVFGGTVNGAGALRLQVSKPYADTVLARVIRQVEEAQARRGRAQRFADRFGATYTPVMFGVAAAVTLLGPLSGLGWTQAFYRSLVVLSVSCSCALVISVPVSVVAAIARAARDGILIKGGAFLEQLGAVEAIAFDKTGTLTAGRLALTRLTPIGAVDSDEVLALAAAVEQASEHPIGTAIVKAAAGRGLHPPVATGAVAFPGRGVAATVRGRRLLAGRPGRGQRADPRVAAEVCGIEDSGATAITLTEYAGARDLDDADGGRVLGVLGVADQLRPDAAQVVAQLRHLGVARQVMLTGDNPQVAAAIATRTGLDGYQAELLPEDKTAAVTGLKARHRVVAMVGDGVNDAPALATAHVAIAMGTAATDVALETADVALMADDLTRLPAAVGLARRARANITQNIALSLAAVAVLVAAALAGLLNLTEGVVLNEGTALLIIANGLRMLRRHPGVARPGTCPEKEGAGAQCTRTPGRVRAPHVPERSGSDRH